MFDESELTGHPDTDLFLLDTLLLQALDPPCEVLLVSFGCFNVVMVEGISADTDTHPCRTHVVVIVKGEEVVPCQVHNHQFPDDTQEGFVFVEYQEVVDEAEVMREAFTGETLESPCQELAASP